MRISLIVAYYKDIESLKLIINSVRLQNYSNFELIVAEDDNSPDIKEYLSSITDIDILHTTQDDNGIQKARSQNNAIIKSTGDYLIFIDGDCIPYTTFISSHAALATEGYILSGRRVNLGMRSSALLRNGTISASTLERYFIPSSPLLMLDGGTHLGQGIHFEPSGHIYKNYISRRKRSNTSLLGCNFSCFKSDITAINGFDESYGATPLADDTDIQWRFEACGLKLKTCKMAANIFHLYHKQKSSGTPEKEGLLMYKRMDEKRSAGDYIATTGIAEHEPR